MKTSGHYDEISKIQRLRNQNIEHMRERIHEVRESHAAVRRNPLSKQANQLRKTTTRKAPAGHH